MCVALLSPGQFEPLPASVVTHVSISVCVHVLHEWIHAQVSMGLWRDACLKFLLHILDRRYFGVRFELCHSGSTQFSRSRYALRCHLIGVLVSIVVVVGVGRGGVRVGVGCCCWRAGVTIRGLTSHK